MEPLMNLCPKMISGVLLAFMPIASFIAQYCYSVQNETERQFFQHLTVTYVDWVFVPFNFLVVYVIDWRRGGVIFAATIASVVLNTAAHAFWQEKFIDKGHMFTSEGVILPGGWVHLAYSNLQMILLLAFIFARKRESRYERITTCLAVAYFVSAGIAGYYMNNGFMVTDVVMVSSGLLFVLVWPALLSKLHAAPVEP
jgi:hypothetical protein